MFRRGSGNEPWVRAWDQENKRPLYGMCQGGSIHDVTALWLIEDRLVSINDQVIIAAHEFGHALGIDHIKEPGHVMSEFYDRRTTTITYEDVVAFYDIHVRANEETWDGAVNGP